MKDAVIGRVLVASMHQAIADVLPDRLEFYENWFHPRGLRTGTMGLGPFNAVLSFLRLEGAPYDAVMSRAGAFAGEWALDGLPASRRLVIANLPRPFRRRAAMTAARRIVAATYTGSRVHSRVRRKEGVLEIRASLFCNVREAVPHPLCGFYASAAVAVLEGLGVPARARVEVCRAMGGAPDCRIALQLDAPAAHDTGETALAESPGAPAA